ncbi:MAG TPA: beta-ketoacyl synthase N-terminal-like domain-containing protein, partial [Stenomitos sp.]
GYQAELEHALQNWYSGQCPTAQTWLWQYGQSPATQVASRLGLLSGPVIAPRAACATGLWAIAQGVELLRTGHCDIVVAGAADAPITPLTLAGFERMGALDREGTFPFDQHRAGLALGEGAALLILEPMRYAQQRGAKAYGRILGFGLTNDAYHPNAPALEGDAAITALQDCLNRSGLSANSVDYIHAHGTGTRLNDATEATLIHKLFPHRPAVSSTKGATGHTLGASGALGAVFCLMALHQQVLPPSVGLQHPESDLNFVFQAQAASLDTVLCLSFGFGGQDAAIAFGRVVDAV